MDETYQEADDLSRLCTSQSRSTSLKRPTPSKQPGVASDEESEPRKKRPRRDASASLDCSRLGDIQCGPSTTKSRNKSNMAFKMLLYKHRDLYEKSGWNKGLVRKVILDYIFDIGGRFVQFTDSNGEASGSLEVLPDDYALDKITWTLNNFRKGHGTASLEQIKSVHVTGDLRERIEASLSAETLDEEASLGCSRLGDIQCGPCTGNSRNKSNLVFRMLLYRHRDLYEKSGRNKGLVRKVILKYIFDIGGRFVQFTGKGEASGSLEVLPDDYALNKISKAFHNFRHGCGKASLEQIKNVRVTGDLRKRIEAALSAQGANMNEAEASKHDELRHLKPPPSIPGGSASPRLQANKTSSDDISTPEEDWSQASQESSDNDQEEHEGEEEDRKPAGILKVAPSTGFSRSIPKHSPVRRTLSSTGISLKAKSKDSRHICQQTRDGTTGDTFSPPDASSEDWSQASQELCCDDQQEEEAVEEGRKPTPTFTYPKKATMSSDGMEDIGDIQCGSWECLLDPNSLRGNMRCAYLLYRHRDLYQEAYRRSNSPVKKRLLREILLDYIVDHGGRFVDIPISCTDVRLAEGLCHDYIMKLFRKTFRTFLGPLSSDFVRNADIFMVSGYIRKKIMCILECN